VLLVLCVSAKFGGGSGYYSNSYFWRITTKHNPVNEHIP
jgi:hypothetical protein